MLCACYSYIVHHSSIQIGGNVILWATQGHCDAQWYISHDSKERAAYEGAEDDHEYEMLDKYSQPYDEVRIPETPPPKQEQQQMSSSGDDYELTQCPAYVPVATTPGVHGKECTISSTDDQPPNSQDNQ